MLLRMLSTLTHRLYIPIFRITLPLLVLVSCSVFTAQIQAQCTKTNATGCLCPDGSDSCDLLPDFKVAEIMLNSSLDVIEYPGEIRLSVSTPNLGFGPMEVISTNFFVCGSDTLFIEDPEGFFCPDGAAPNQLVKQITYHKDGSSMDTISHWAGSMTYHPTHGHLHVDDWAHYTLRTPLEGVDDPLEWTIVAEGFKLGFCLQDTGDCFEDYPGHAVDDSGTTLATSDEVPNFNLGGGNYNQSCGLNHGISVGYTDVYDYSLDGQDIPLDNVCNGDYYIVVEVNPDHTFIESNYDNNVGIAPVSLSLQEAASSSFIQATGPTVVCAGESVQLSALNGSSYEWSDGQTDALANFTASGDYFVQVQTDCGIRTSDTIHVEILENGVLTFADDGAACDENSFVMTASSENGTPYWFDELDATLPIDTGDTFITPILYDNEIYYVAAGSTYPGLSALCPPFANNIGLGGINPLVNGALVFDALDDFYLKSVRVYPSASGAERTFQLRNEAGDLLEEVTAVVSGTQYSSTIDLNFFIPAGTGYMLGSPETPDLFRNNSGVEYPYVVDGVVQITSAFDGESLDHDHYYYYYEWTVETSPITCYGPKEALEANVFPCPGIEEQENEGPQLLSATIQNGHLQLLFSDTDFTFAQGQNELEGVIPIQLFDLNGKLLRSGGLQLSGTNEASVFDQLYLNNGIYFISWQIGDKVHYQKFFF